MSFLCETTKRDCDDKLETKASGYMPLVSQTLVDINLFIAC